jgi:rhamnulose-1-phosphate aldolase
MEKRAVELPTVREVIRLASNMYRQGWDERNGGNISVIIDPEEYQGYLPEEPKKVFPLAFDATPLIGKVFVVTGTGKYLKNIEYSPETNLGIVRIGKDGHSAELLWGFEDGGRPTSEFPTHMMSHIVRLKKDPKHHVVIHCHATHALALTYVLPEDEDEITRTLWRMSTECIVVFPEGVGYLPWMLCGGNAIGEATAKKAENYRIVLWGMHGIFGMGETIDEAFGLIETVEKASTIYFLTQGHVRQNITNEDLICLANAFHVNYKKIL